MSSVEPVAIDVEEDFPLLTNAPIIEAVVEIRTRATTQFTDELVTRKITELLPDYPQRQPQRAIEMFAHFDSHGLAEQSKRDHWRGLKVTTADGKQIAQFKPDGFIFSRIAPYESWERFRTETLRLWSIHAEIAKPTEIQRIGVRFINRMSVSRDGKKTHDYLRTPPQSPVGFEIPIRTFLHKETFEVPGHPYSLNRVQTIQLDEGSDAALGSVILDIDVYSTVPNDPDLTILNRRLSEMRWLKDKVFFGSITNEARTAFGN